jgi:hypothetical protein
MICFSSQQVTQYIPMYISTLTTPLDKRNREQPKYLTACTMHHRTPKGDKENRDKRKVKGVGLLTNTDPENR